MMYQQTDSDKLQQSIRNPFAFYFPIKKGIQWAGTDATPCLTLFEISLELSKDLFTHQKIHRKHKVGRILFQV